MSEVIAKVEVQKTRYTVFVKGYQMNIAGALNKLQELSTQDPRGLPRYAPLDPRRESVVIRMLARAAEQGQFHRADMRTLGNYLRADRTAQQAAHLRDMDIMAYCAQQRQEGCLPAFYAAEFGLDLGSAVSLYDIATRL